MIILVVVDRFYETADFSMVPNHFTAVKVDDLFAEIIFRFYGMPIHTFHYSNHFQSRNTSKFESILKWKWIKLMFNIIKAYKTIKSRFLALLLLLISLWTNKASTWMIDLIVSCIYCTNIRHRVLLLVFLCFFWLSWHTRLLLHICVIEYLSPMQVSYFQLLLYLNFSLCTALHMLSFSWLFQW